ncbi:MAG: hypothetical protein ACRC2H_11060 [Silanimonas sp.]
MSGRLRCAAAFLALLWAAVAQGSAHHAEAMGTHGMLLVGGRDGLFASHLPMFHPPHDAQVVLAISLDDAELQRELADALAREPRVWTLVPEPFDLHRLAPDAAEPLRHFRADVVDGHFERGGTLRHRGVAVTVSAVPVFRALDPRPRSTTRVEYLRIGARHDAVEQFLVLRIDARPGADHVLAVRPGTRRLPDRLVLEADAADGLGGSLAAIRRSLRAHDATLRSEIYRETGDLK